MKQGENEQTLTNYELFNLMHGLFFWVEGSFELYLLLYNFQCILFVVAEKWKKYQLESEDNPN